MSTGEDPATQNYDVIVVGTGMAGIASALSASEAGANVLVLDKAERHEAGGSTRFSGGGFRVPTDTYSPDDLFADLMLVTQGRGNQELLRQMVDRAAEDIEWLQGYGLRFGDPAEFRPDVAARRHRIYMAEPAPFEWHGAMHIGSGNSVVQNLHPALFEAATVICGTRAERLLVDDQRRIRGVRCFQTGSGYVEFIAPTVILACGGFQANARLRSGYFARPAANWVVRGTRHNTGDGIRMAMDIGAGAAGEWSDFHCAVVDGRSARVEAGETNINTYPFTIMVNANGERFLDEGQDYRDRTYARFGRLILEQPGSRAHLIFDSQVSDLVKGLISAWGPVSAPTLEALAEEIGVDAEGLTRTVEEFNAGVQPGEYDPMTLDGKKTVGVTPPKSNWALTIEQAPFFALPVTGGVTFTFGGLRTDTSSRVLDDMGDPIDGLFAAGEIQGDFFYFNYPSGSSLVRCSVYGRIAGANAASYAASSTEVGLVD